MEKIKYHSTGPKDRRIVLTLDTVRHAFWEGATIEEVVEVGMEAMITDRRSIVLKMADSGVIGGQLGLNISNSKKSGVLVTINSRALMNAIDSLGLTEIKLSENTIELV